MPKENKNNWASDFFLSYLSYWLGSYLIWSGVEYFWFDLRFWFALMGYPNLWFEIVDGWNWLPPNVKSMRNFFN